MSTPMIFAASPNTVYNGIREYGLVTNTFGGYITSAGAAYTLQLPFQADKFEWTNFTKFSGTNATNVQGVWYRGYPAANATILTVATSPALTATAATSGGITIANTGPGFLAEQYTITGIAAGVVTVSAAIPLNAASPYSRVIITQVVGTVGPQVNNTTFVAVPLTTTTFQLYDIYGVPITQVGTYSSSGQATLTGPSLGIVNAPRLYFLTLGTAVMGVSMDLIYFTATQMNNYQSHLPPN